MKALFSGRISPAKAALFVAVIMIAWPVFLFFRPPAEDKESLPPRSSVAPLSRLRAVGLADNADWEDMPGFFAVWADKLEWKNDRTQFAYWNPGSNSYSYLFEASRVEGKVRFRVISKKEALPGAYVSEDDRGNFVPMEISIMPGGMTNWEILKDSPTHPFVFFQELSYETRYPVHPVRMNPVVRPPGPGPTSIPVSVEKKPISLTDTETKDEPKPDDPGKK